ncbi:hypothetical protein KEJ17_08640, partial [Candidatus Bathyarchaeota archaeon]|nr:hypothetical protein [Candidatus Bathyarchaeota archaeon]
MVKFRQKLDRNEKIYIPKILREAGFDKVLEIFLSSYAAVIYPAEADLGKVIQNSEIIIQD